ncbi:MAG: nucleoside diphosphate kinase regulator [Betaproteobacteria bacterium]
MSHDHSILITESDFARLRRLASHPYLAKELEKAEIVDSRRIPRDVVTMGSRIRFQDDTTGVIRDITIVFPDQAEASQGKISVLAPIGTALLGLSVGQSIRWPFPDESMRTLRVLELIYQPEAEKFIGADARH